MPERRGRSSDESYMRQQESGTGFVDLGLRPTELVGGKFREGGGEARNQHFQVRGSKALAAFGPRIAWYSHGMSIPDFPIFGRPNRENSGIPCFLILAESGIPSPIPGGNPRFPAKSGIGGTGIGDLGLCHHLAWPAERPGHGRCTTCARAGSAGWLPCSGPRSWAS